MSSIAHETLDQFETLLISMLDSSEEQTVALLSAAFLDSVLALAYRDGPKPAGILVVCDDHEIMIRKVERPPESIH